MRAEKIELREVRLPLVHFFETSFHRIHRRRILLTRVYADGQAGYGECTAPEDPFYSHETIDSAWHIIRDFIAPQLLGRTIVSSSEISPLLRRIRGHNMAKGGVEAAFWDLEARIKQLPLWKLLGGVEREVPCGVSIGIQDSIEQLLEKITTELKAGYRRIKIKIKPGWDYDVIERVRREFPEINLMADANSAYSLEDLELLRSLDGFNLMMIEQPLAHDDLVDHAELQRQLRTPICLDESIRHAEDARKAVALGSCRIINVKLGRVGGHAEARRLHDFCRQNGVPLWCGGMLESGVGRAHNIAMSSLPGFTLPGDVSASKRYYQRDIIKPPVEVTPRGTIVLPDRPGIGYEPDLEWIDELTARREVLEL